MLGISQCPYNTIVNQFQWQHKLSGLTILTPLVLLLFFSGWKISKKSVKFLLFVAHELGHVGGYYVDFIISHQRKKTICLKWPSQWGKLVEGAIFQSPVWTKLKVLQNIQCELYWKSVSRPQIKNCFLIVKIWFKSGPTNIAFSLFCLRPLLKT